MRIEKVISRAKRKDQQAYRELFEAYGKSMFAASYRITNHKEESKDILQECFLTSFQKLKDLKDPASYPAWLRKMIINKSIKYTHSKVITYEMLDSDIIEDQAENWFRNISWSELRLAIQNLPDGCRSVFTLFAIEDFKHREIAELLSISISTSKSQYKYACKVLQSKLKKHIDYEH